MSVATMFDYSDVDVDHRFDENSTSPHTHTFVVTVPKNGSDYWFG